MAEFENDQEQENIVQKSEIATNENETTSEAALSEYGPNGFSLSTTQLAADESPTNKKLYQFQETADASKTDSISTLKEIQLKAQQKATNYYSNTSGVTQFKENKTGLPNKLKSGVENLSGQSLDDVKVHRNSDKPAQLEAHAYAQGNDIHLGPGKEKHLPHEAWHVAQQKQGRVKPTVQKKGVKINDSEALEKEADQMGAKAMNFSSTSDESYQLKEANQTNKSVAQLNALDGVTVEVGPFTVEDGELSFDLFGQSVTLSKKGGKVQGSLPSKKIKFKIPGSLQLSIDVPVAPGVYATAGLEIAPELGVKFSGGTYTIEEKSGNKSVSLAGAGVSGDMSLSITAKAGAGVGLANVAGIDGGIFATAQASAALSGSMDVSADLTKKSYSGQGSIAAEADIVGKAGTFIKAKLLSLSAEKKWTLAKKKFAHFKYTRALKFSKGENSWYPRLQDFQQAEYGEKVAAKKKILTEG